MSKICKDLHEIAHVLDQFYKFLGSELKEVRGAMTPHTAVRSCQSFLNLEIDLVEFGIS